MAASSDNQEPDLPLPGSSPKGHSEPEEGFYWRGKGAAYALAVQPPVSQLQPLPDASVHWGTTANLLIEGENSEALKLLQSDYAGKVRLVYIDPPYNTGSDRFLYRDKFTGRRKNARPGTEGGSSHAAWLSMMLPRLLLARKLLREDGTICISIDDHEVHHLRLLLDEVFGEEQFVATLVWRRRKTQANLSRHISPVHDYILCYAKDITAVRVNRLPYHPSFIGRTFSNPDDDPRGPYQTRPLAQPESASNTAYELRLPNGRRITARWSCSAETFQRYVAEDRLVIPKGGRGMPRLKIFLSEGVGAIPNTWLDDIASNEEGSREIRRWFGTGAVFTSPKPTALIRHLLQLGTDSDSLVLDFFAGSGTTAEAVLRLNEEDGGNRSFICIQWPEPTPPNSAAYAQGYRDIAAICRERIRLVLEAGARRGVQGGCRVYRLERAI